MRIRLNKSNLYPTGEPKQAGYKDTHFDYTCSECGKIILRKESQMSIPGKAGVKRYHLNDACLPKLEGK